MGIGKKSGKLAAELSTRHKLEEFRSGKMGRTISIPIDRIDSFEEKKEILENAKKNLRVYFIPFCSHVEFPEKFMQEENRRYYLRFYLPKMSSKPFRNLFILLNGLGEAGPLIYDDIGLELSMAGIPSVLFPIPSHFHRRKDFISQDNDIFAAADNEESKFSTQAIMSEIAASPEKIIYDYKHSMADFNNFLTAIDGNRRDVNPSLNNFYNKFFHKNVSLFTLGYSLGGLLALSFLLKYPNRIKACYLLESGANFGQINAGILFMRDYPRVKIILKKVRGWIVSGEKSIDEVESLLVTKHDSDFDKREYRRIARAFKRGKGIEDIDLKKGCFTKTLLEGENIWFELVKDLRKIYDDARKPANFSNEEADIFEKIIFGDKGILYREDLKQNCKKIFIILGGSDAIFQIDAITSFSPRETGLAILQIPNLGHWLKFSYREVWREWKRFIMKTIIEFGNIY
jgi:pimeloyl-ACP methyl ester carboxylesterase